jgi:acyl-CoA synthetase (AMP-forming)/AMP-acid ligase II
VQLIDFFDRGARHFPARACLVADDLTMTYEEVRRASHVLAAHLAAQGAGSRTKVAVLSPNRPEALLAILGLLRAGCAWVPLNARSTREELAHVAEMSECEWLFYHSRHADSVAALQHAAPRLKHFVCLDAVRGPHESMRDILVRARDARAVDAHGAVTDPCTIFPTGGTTGKSKGAIWTHRTWNTFIANFHAAFPLRRPAVHLIVAPMTHAAGVIAFPLMALGATNVLIDSTDPAEILARVETHRATTMFLPPTLIYRLLAHPNVRRHDYSSLEMLLYAAAPMSVDKLKEAWEVFGPVLAQSFGQAEAPMVCTTFNADEHARCIAAGDDARLASCGRAGLLTEVAIMSPDGALLEPGETGEIVVRGDLVMQGYYNNPVETAASSRNGWHRTGDVGRQDADGYVYITDRLRDMIISGGFNIFPGEIEQVIWSHACVQDCAVIGVPDDYWGEAVTAVIEPKAGQRVVAAEIIELCKRRLGSVKAPKHVHVVQALPRSAVGKVLKREIRTQFWAGRARQV